MQYIENILDNFYAPLIGNALYILVVFGMRAILRVPKEKEEREKLSAYYNKLAALHNFILTIESLAMAVGILQSLISIHFEGGSIWSWYCDPNQKTFQTKGYESYRFWQKMYYYSKFHETFDTILVVLKRGPITFLALFHHSIMIHATYQVNFPDNRSYVSMWMPSFLNTVIHVVMYSYFTIRSLGVKENSFSFINFVRENITRMQITQFVIILIYAAPLNPLALPQCTVTWRVWGWCFVPVFIIMIFFINFYIQQYVNKKRQAKQQKKD